ncbi:MAG: extracellular solute-binding protein [Spirochaetia bacterium]
MKKKNLFKGIVIAFIFAVLLPMTAAASGNQENGSAEGEGSGEPDRLKMFLSDNKQAIPAKKSMELPDIAYLGEQTNTYLDIDFQPHSSHGEQTRLKITAGDIPDVLQRWGIPEYVLELKENDQLMPLTEYIESSPNMYNAVPKEVWNSLKMDGDIMGIPQLRPSAAGQIFYIRGDWMDELGLETPETSEELLDVFRAFKGAKPDAYPFSMRVNFSWGTNIFGMFGVDNNGLAVYEGKVIPQQIHPRMKEALKYFRTMYEEELIDPEFLLNDSPTWQQKITSGKVGSWVHVAQYGSWWHEKVSAALPEENVDVRTFPTPQGAGYNGPVGQSKRSVDLTYWVHKESKNPEAVVRLFDFLYTEKGNAYAMLGVPGRTYSMENGEYVYNEEAEDPAVSEWRQSMFNMLGYNENVMRARYEPNEFKKYKRGIEIARAEGLPNPTLGITVEDALDLYMTWVEVAAKIVVEGETITLFDEFVENWMKNGGAEEVERMTNWLKNK